MSALETYRNKTFSIADSDARVRRDDNLMQYRVYAAGDALPPGAAVGDFVRVPVGTVVRIDNLRIVPTGSKSVTIFADVSMAGGGRIGWTSVRNFRGRFLSETLGAILPPPGAGKFSSNAAWTGGDYLGQITLVRILGTGDEVEYIAEAVAAPLVAMIDAAAAAGIAVSVNSGFRTYSEQKYLYDGYVAGKPGFNKAAKPGSSNHQNGIAFDISVSGGAGNPTYDWLAREATAHGFLRTVSGEPWHWEYRPAEAADARAKGRHGRPGAVP